MSGQLVRDVMTKPVSTVTANENLLAARDAMWRVEARHLPVVNASGRLQGILSQRDLWRALGDLAETPSSELDDSDRPQGTVAQVMTRDVEAIPPTASAMQAAHLIYRAKIGCLPVVERSKVVGIVTESDFVRLFIQSGGE